ncbi:kinase 2 [Pristimantis euphronides]
MMSWSTEGPYHVTWCLHLYQSPKRRDLSPFLSCKGSEDLEWSGGRILHPGLGQQVKMDLLIMKTWSKLLNLMPGFKWLSLPEIVEEFEKLMTQQIDLHFEARNLETFQQKFEKIDFIKFPTPLQPFVTKNILVETFEDGEPMTLYLQEKGSSEIKRRIAAMGVDMLLKMIFVDNFVHADLYPGNILIQGILEFSPGHTDQTTLVDMCDTLIVDVRPGRSPLRLVLLDAGIVAELQEKDLENFRSVFTAVVLGQGDTVAELILHHTRANECVDVESFKSQMAELVNEARKNTVALGKLQVSALLSRVFQLLMTHKVKLESNFASIVFAILVLEGLGRSLDPEIDILEAAKPLLLRSAASMM